MLSFCVRRTCTRKTLASCPVESGREVVAPVFLQLKAAVRGSSFLQTQTKVRPAPRLRPPQRKSHGRFGVWSSIENAKTRRFGALNGVSKVEAPFKTPFNAVFNKSGPPWQETHWDTSADTYCSWTLRRVGGNPRCSFCLKLEHA